MDPQIDLLPAGHENRPFAPMASNTILLPVEPGISESAAHWEWHDAALGFSVAFSWLLLFAAGFLVPSAPFRQDFADPGRLKSADPGQLLLDGVVVMTCWTVTNIAFLCSFAALLGTAIRRADPDPGGSTGAAREYSTGALSGFFVYLAVMAGAIGLGSQEGFADANNSQYLKIAATGSLLSFIVGYKRNPVPLVLQLLNGFSGRAGTGIGQESGAPRSSLRLPDEDLRDIAVLSPLPPDAHCNGNGGVGR